MEKEVLFKKRTELTEEEIKQIKKCPLKLEKRVFKKTGNTQYKAVLRIAYDKQNDISVLVSPKAESFDANKYNIIKLKKGLPMTEDIVYLNVPVRFFTGVNKTNGDVYKCFEALVTERITLFGFLTTDQIELLELMNADLDFTARTDIEITDDNLLENF